MSRFVILFHPILAALLFFGYFLLAIRFLDKKKKKANALDKSLAQIVRFVLLLLYLTGLLMSMNLHIYVGNFHHYLSLLPVLILFAFQFMPSVFKKDVTIKDYAWMFVSMVIIILLVALSSRISYLPHF